MTERYFSPGRRTVDGNEYVHIPVIHGKSAVRAYPDVSGRILVYGPDVIRMQSYVILPEYLYAVPVEPVQARSSPYPRKSVAVDTYCSDVVVAQSLFIEDSEER